MFQCVCMCVKRVCTVPGDVSKVEVGEVLSKAVVEIGKTVDVLINCAGITHTAALLDTPVKTYQVRITWS